MTTPEVLVVGDWHLASVTSAGLLSYGYRVHAWDADAAARSVLAAAGGTAAEPGVRPELRQAREQGRYTVVPDETALAEIVATVELAVVGYDSRTTVDGEMIDTRIAEAVGLLLRLGRGRCPVLLSSQVRAGTCDQLLTSAGEPTDSPLLVHVPENLRLGRALDDFRHPQRVVIGCNADRLPEPVERLAARWDPARVVRVNLVEAELIKHGTNGFLSACIVFANDLGWLARDLGADPFRVLAGVQADPRIGSHAPLRPGQAYAGATLQRDVRALQEAGEPCGRDGLFAAISRANSNHALAPVGYLDRLLDGLAERRICLYGLTYKPNISTLRDSPALRLAGELAAHGCRVTGYDPLADDLPPGDIHRYPTPAEAAAGADCVVLVTAHDGFDEIDFATLRPRRRRLLDLCGAGGRVKGLADWQVYDMWRN